jgi:hypothetical protein
VSTKKFLDFYESEEHQWRTKLDGKREGIRLLPTEIGEKVEQWLPIGVIGDRNQRKEGKRLPIVVIS